MAFAFAWGWQKKLVLKGTFYKDTIPKDPLSLSLKSLTRTPICDIVTSLICVKLLMLTAKINFKIKFFNCRRERERERERERVYYK